MRAGALQSKPHKKKEKSPQASALGLADSSEQSEESQPINNQLQSNPPIGDQLQSSQPIGNEDVSDTAGDSDTATNKQTNGLESSDGGETLVDERASEGEGHIGVAEPHMVDIHDGLPVCIFYCDILRYTTIYITAISCTAIGQW